MELFFEIGPVAAALREVRAGPEKKGLVSKTLEKALAPYESPVGLLMPGAAWIVTASNS